LKIRNDNNNNINSNNTMQQQPQQQPQQQQRQQYANTVDDAMLQLPDNRFELELEFVQALASPAYIHFLATTRSNESHNTIDDFNGQQGNTNTNNNSNNNTNNNGEVLLQDPALICFLRYLYNTWTRPEYIRFLQYPHSLYFLQLLLENPAAAKEWTLPAYRNFAHQQQFLSWQHRHSTYYGVGATTTTTTTTTTTGTATSVVSTVNENNTNTTGTPNNDPSVGTIGIIDPNK
jgi:mediator of RNA polymerase II transcription subunit 31